MLELSSLLFLRCFSDKLCSRVTLPAGKKSEIHPLFGKTISVLVLTSQEVSITLHEKPQTDSARYRFNIGGNSKSTIYLATEGGSEVSKDSADISSYPFHASQWRTFWIDFRSSKLVLGSGSEVILQWDNPNPFSISYVSFTADGSSETRIILCNKESKSGHIMFYKISC